MSSLNLLFYTPPGTPPSKNRSLFKKALKATSCGTRYFLRLLFSAKMIRHKGVLLHVLPTQFERDVLHALYKGYYELGESHLLQHTLEKEDRVLELGAGIGFMGLKAAQKLKSTNQLLLVEANPDLIPLIQANAKANKVNLNTLNCVLGKGDGLANFYIRENFTGSSLSPGDHIGVKQIPQKDAQALIDSFKPTYLIIDIEGGEFELLPTLKLDSVRKICIEVHPATVQPINEKYQAVSKMIASLSSQGFGLDIRRTKGAIFYFSKS